VAPLSSSYSRSTDVRGIGNGRKAVKREPRDPWSIREEIVSIARRHGVTSIRVFGSWARGEESLESDLDLLIEVGPDHSRWFPGGLVVDLEELVGRRVDVVEPRSLPPERRAKVLAESVRL
jgi:predicted nucleotidyltransferase